LSAAMRSADLVIAHAGAGSAVSAMRAGHRPVLVPRHARHSEHGDVHQVQIAAELGRQGLAIPLRVEDLTWEELVSRRRRVTLLSSPPEFPLTAGLVRSPDSRVVAVAGQARTSVRLRAPSHAPT
ncbi:MAG: glycosyltransferase, partial [Acidimicrobiales bacterium]